MHSRILFLLLFTLCAGYSIAQQNPATTARSLSSVNTGNAKLYYANRNEPPRAIEFNERTVAVSSFLTNINHYFSIPVEFTFREAESDTDKLGMRHRVMDLYYRGIPVEGMGYRVHEKNGFVTSANGKAVRHINVNMQLNLTEEQAFRVAVKHLESKDSVFRGGRKLIVSKDFTFTPESFSVAFQFDVDVSLIERWRISIDARTGEVLNKTSLVHSCSKEKGIQPLPYGTGTGLTNYYGRRTISVETYENGSSRLFGQTENGGMIRTMDFRNGPLIILIFGFPYTVYDFYSPNNIYDDAYQRPAVSVQWAAEQAYEYFFKKHSRNSFDNKGSTILSYVHVDKDLNNAFWTGKALAFGDGSNNNPLVELDVVSHELTHGVTQYEAQLRYSYEPGALNESFSDIFAKAVEFYTFGDTATWQLARHYRAGGLRDFSNPNLKSQPDTYQGYLWHTGAEDNGGVHYNSGVQNFWFYLLCEGGDGVNDHGTEYTVGAIGMEAATAIAYRNLTEYLGYFSDYFDSRVGSLLATADLYGKNSTEYNEVANAWDAVGVIDEPIITGMELYDITATTVKIRGSLIPRGDNVTYHFEYGTTSDFGTSTPLYQYNGTIEAMIKDLQSETRYYLRLVATNENGSSYAVTEFTTISLAPLVNIVHTVDVTETTATVYGQVNPNSLPTSFYFEYGLTPAFGMATASFQLSDTTEYLNVSASLADLEPRNTYYYRLVATNEFTSSNTESANFFTAVSPVITSFAPVVATAGTEITITGRNFTPGKESNLVSFGATRATVLSASSSEVTVTVPSGASFGTITLQDTQSGLVAESAQEFMPTFTGEFRKGSLQLKVGIPDVSTYRTAVHDVDGDGRPDIVASHYQSFSVYLNVNQGGEINEHSFVKNTFPSTFLASADIQLVDLNGDGRKDVVARSRNGVVIYPNLSVPGYVFFGVPVEVPTSPGSIALRDFDQDGRIDLAIMTSREVYIYRNQNPKGFLSSANFPQSYRFSPWYYLQSMSSNDVNNDGKPDLLLAPDGGYIAPILINKSSPGVFEFEEIGVDDPARNRFTGYLAHDLNNNGSKDLIVHSRYLDGTVRLIENNGGTDGFYSGDAITILNEPHPVTAVALGDISGGQNIDILTGHNNRTFTLLTNNGQAGEGLSEISFTDAEVNGMSLSDVGSGTVEARLTVNDLNGDGRPDIIASYSYSYGPNDGYKMEIWENSAEMCLDPSLITLDVALKTATILLPPNTTLDQFEIQYRYVGSEYWWTVSSTTLSYLSAGYPYELRARAICHLWFTDYHYINFSVDCVDLNSFKITNIGTTSAIVSASDFGMFEVQYSKAGENNWISLPQYQQQLFNLLPGTRYDVRFRGRCYVYADFRYKQFTTLCPSLYSLTVSDLTYNRAVASWTHHSAGTPLIEYSVNNADWTLVDETGIMYPLTPGTTYFVRGSLTCSDDKSGIASTAFTTPCPKVSLLKSENVTPFSADIAWQDESLTGSYTVTYAMEGGPVSTLETSSTMISLEGLTPGTRYSVSVAPHCAMAKDFTTITFSTVCFTPFHLSVSDITFTSADLSWDDHHTGVPYIFRYTIVGNNVWHTTETSLRHISLTDLRPGTRYEARVNIPCTSQEPPYISLRFETLLYEQTTYAPNPTDGRITIYPSTNLIGKRFTLHDNAGRLVADGVLKEYTVDLSALSAGIFILKIAGEKHVKVVKH
jgi:Zn-dependent metalloprotease